MLQYEKLKKEEIKLASELAARAYFDYIYITIFFPGLKERQRGLARNVIMRYNDTIIKFYNFPVRPKVPMRVPSEPFYY